MNSKMVRKGYLTFFCATVADAALLHPRPVSGAPSLLTYDPDDQSYAAGSSDAPWDKHVEGLAGFLSGVHLSGNRGHGSPGSSTRTPGSSSLLSSAMNTPLLPFAVPRAGTGTTLNLTAERLEQEQLFSGVLAGPEKPDPVLCVSNPAAALNKRHMGYSTLEVQPEPSYALSQPCLINEFEHRDSQGHSQVYRAAIHKEQRGEQKGTERYRMIFTSRSTGEFAGDVRFYLPKNKRAQFRGMLVEAKFRGGVLSRVFLATWLQWAYDNGFRVETDEMWKPLMPKLLQNFGFKYVPNPKSPNTPDYRKNKRGLEVLEPLLVKKPSVTARSDSQHVTIVPPLVRVTKTGAQLPMPFDDHEREQQKLHIEETADLVNFEYSRVWLGCKYEVDEEVLVEALHRFWKSVETSIIRRNEVFASRPSSFDGTEFSSFDRCVSMASTADSCDVEMADSSSLRKGQDELSHGFHHFRNFNETFGP